MIGSDFSKSQAYKSQSSAIPNSDYDLEHRKDLFERFLTYRRRMSRMAGIMNVYMLDSNIIASSQNLQSQDNLFNTKTSIKPEIFVHSIIYIYKNYFFNKKTYGVTNKTKKLDERFLFELTAYIIENLEDIDHHIAQNLNPKWTVASLDSLVRSILRCAIGERLMLGNIETAIITSEYTNLSSYFFTGREIGFINGVIHSHCNKYKIKHPDFD